MSQTNETYTSIMDNESFSQKDVDALLADDSQREQWTSFHLISDLMQNKTADVVAPTLHQRIAVAIADEPTLMLPDAVREVKAWRRTVTNWLEQVGSYAVAASVTIAILYGIQLNQAPQTLQPTTAGKTLELLQPENYVVSKEISPLQEQLLDISRMSSIYGGQTVAPYVRGVNYSIEIPLKPIVKKAQPEPSDKQQSEQKPNQ
ncbi:MAG: hypothetical protein KJO69_06770 [Gammaproteobacteria bacterium]|nr:hypothetical protein [Gammaproteobacteria bacterium]